MTLGDAILIGQASIGVTRFSRPSWDGRYFVVVIDVRANRPPGTITDVRNADGTDAPNEFTAEDKSAEDWMVL